MGLRQTPPALCYLPTLGNRATHHLTPAGPVPGAENMRNLFGPITLKAALLCLVVSIVAGGVAYGVGHSLQSVYQASGTIRIALPSQGGLSDPVVIASNDLATQYAQLVDTPQVRALAAASLAVAPASLDGKLSGSTVSAQNLLKVTATGSSSAAAQARAKAAVAAVQRYLSGLTTVQNAQYLASLKRGLNATPLLEQRLRIGRLGTGQLSVTVAGLRGEVLNQGVRDAAGNQPSFQVVDPGAGATVTYPKPSLYALVAFVVVLLISLRVAFVASRSGEADRRAP
jgi:capsular polysaccharide biosynthesis protein